MFSSFKPKTTLEASSQFTTLDETESTELEKKVVLLKIIESVWRCGSDKPRGLDGYTLLSSSKVYGIT